MKKVNKFLSILLVFPLLTSCSFFISKTIKYKTILNINFEENIESAYFNDNILEINTKFKSTYNQMLKNATFYFDNRGAFDKFDGIPSRTTYSLKVDYNNDIYFKFSNDRIDYNGLSTYTIYSNKKEEINGYFFTVYTNIDVSQYVSDSLSKRVIRKFKPYVDLIVQLENEEAYNSFLSFASSLDN